MRMYVCKVSIDTGYVRRNFKTELFQINSDTPYNNM